MEQHPVPQNVTTFQFRLIGDMTLKQFGYLAGGAILSYVSYKLPLPLFLNWPLAILFALGGFGFAFVPVEERPMDVWVLSFFKSIYSPTQYVWKKNVPAPQAPAVEPPPLAAPPARSDILNTLFVPQDAPLAQQKPAGPFDWIARLFVPAPRSGPLPADQPAKVDFTPPPTVRARQDVRAAEPPQPQAQPVPPPAPIPSGPLPRVESPQVEAGTYVATPASHAGPSVRIITPDRAVKAGLPRLTTFPNVVTGIVKDGDQNLLPAVLVTVKDKEGVPLRALKTNRLGQFAASTPLPNGTYLVEIEDPRLRYTFDRAQITLNGSIVPAIEIFAKSQKEITRAKLEKELFGNQN